MRRALSQYASFNSQPLEGGCVHGFAAEVPVLLFQLTAARRRLLFLRFSHGGLFRFQLTAARRRLPIRADVHNFAHLVSTHSRSKAAASVFEVIGRFSKVSTHSRSKAAAPWLPCGLRHCEFQLTAARRRLHVLFIGIVQNCWFQLTAARRRLPPPRHAVPRSSSRFNSQPLEGGCKRPLPATPQ